MTTIKSLAARICDVMAQCKTLEKDGFNKQQNYKYVTESTVADTIRKLAGEAGIAIFPSVDSVEKVEAGHTNSGNVWWLTKVWVVYTLINAENPDDKLISRHYAEALDTADKGIYKALTNCHKYMLLRTFCLGSDDDVENDGKEAGQGAPPAQGGAPQGRGQKSPSAKSGRGAQPPPPAQTALWLYDTNDIAESETQIQVEEYLQAQGATFNSDLNVFESAFEIKKCQRFATTAQAAQAKKERVLAAQQSSVSDEEKEDLRARIAAQQQNV